MTVQLSVLHWPEPRGEETAMPEHAWAARMRGKYPETLLVEMRKVVKGAFGGQTQVRAVAHASGAVEISMNGTAVFSPDDWRNLQHAVNDARVTMASFLAATVRRDDRDYRVSG